MDLCTKHRVDEGLHIEGKGHSVDIIVRDIEKAKKIKAAILELRGIPATTNLYLKPADGLVELIDGIQIAVTNNNNKSSIREVEIYYRTSKGFTTEKRRYK